MSKPKIYIDSCCFIDAVTHSVGAGAQLEEGRDGEVFFLKKLLEASQAGDIEAYTSIISIAECVKARGNKSDNMNDEVKRLFKSILTSGKITIPVQPDINIAERARDLQWQNGIALGGIDAMHIASALDMGCKEFLTVDEGILKRADQIKILGVDVIKPSQTQSLPDEYRQEKLLGETDTKTIKPMYEKEDDE